MATAPESRRPAAFSWERRRVLGRAALVAVLSSALLGCAGTPTPDGGGDTSSATPTNGDGSVPGAPNRNHGTSGGGGAAGSPLKVPARLQDQGRPLAEVSAEIESGLRDECGGQLCVTLRTEQRDEDGFTACTFIETVPPQRSFVARGGTVTIVSGSAPCTETTQPESPSESPFDSGSTS